MGLQISLQNVADLAKYVVTLILSQPRQFRWAALVSFCSVCLAVGFYAVRRGRGAPQEQSRTRMAPSSCPLCAS